MIRSGLLMLMSLLLSTHAAHAQTDRSISVTKAGATHTLASTSTIAPHNAERIGPDFSYAIDLGVGFAPSQELQIEAGYMYSTLVNATSQGGGAYLPHWRQSPRSCFRGST
jgi:opacity protein-like surface antigen